MDKQKNNTDPIMFTILLPVLSIGCSVGISFLEKKIGVIYTIAILGAFLILIPIALYIGMVILSSFASFSIERQIDLDFKNIQIETAESRVLDGVCTEEQLALMEKTYPFEEIWLVSPDLLTEVNDGVYANVVSDNLKKGTKYKYFVPRSAINSARVNIFRNNCRNNKNLEIYFLDEDFFFLVPKVDFAIYEPLKSSYEGKKGYMGLPIEGSKDNFAILMSEDLVDMIIGKLAEYQSGKSLTN